MYSLSRCNKVGNILAGGIYRISPSSELKPFFGLSGDFIGRELAASVPSKACIPMSEKARDHGHRPRILEHLHEGTSFLTLASPVSNMPFRLL